MLTPDTSADDRRCPHLQAAVDDITEYVTSRLAVYADAIGSTPDFSITLIDGDFVEVSAKVADFDGMAKFFCEQMSDWVDMGLLSPDPDDDDDGPLFTATLPPAKVRPQ